MTTKPYKFNEDENNSSRVSEPVTAYGKSYNAIYNNELSEAGLRFEADKIYEAIQNGRQSGITRHIIPFDK